MLTDDCASTPRGRHRTAPGAWGQKRSGPHGSRYSTTSARFEAQEDVGADDRVVQLWRDHFYGGHVRGVDVFRIRDGKVAEKLSYAVGLTPVATFGLWRAGTARRRHRSRPAARCRRPSASVPGWSGTEHLLLGLLEASAPASPKRYQCRRDPGRMPEQVAELVGPAAVVTSLSSSITTGPWWTRIGPIAWPSVSIPWSSRSTSSSACWTSKAGPGRCCAASGWTPPCCAGAYPPIRLDPPPVTGPAPEPPPQEEEEPTGPPRPVWSRPEPGGRSTGSPLPPMARARPAHSSRLLRQVRHPATGDPGTASGPVGGVGARGLEAEHHAEVVGGVGVGNGSPGTGRPSLAQIGSQPSPGCQSISRSAGMVARTSALCFS